MLLALHLRHEVGGKPVGEVDQREEVGRAEAERGEDCNAGEAKKKRKEGGEEGKGWVIRQEAGAEMWDIRRTFGLVTTINQGQRLISVPASL